MTAPDFAGSDYAPLFDRARLASQFERVRDAALGEAWKTLRELAAETGDPAASISAQLRHATKPEFGALVLEKRSRGERTRGLFEYRLRPHGTPTQQKRRRTPLRDRMQHLEEALSRMVSAHPCRCDAPGCSDCLGRRALGGGA